MRAEVTEGLVATRNPMRGILVNCCAAARDAVINKAVANNQTMFLPNIEFIVNFISPLMPLDSRLSNHLIRPRQHIRRNRQTDLFRRLQIDDELELARL